MWQEANARSFTVARVTAMDVLVDIKKEVDRALAEGVSLAEFKQDLGERLAAKGWFAPKGEAAKIELPDGTIRKRLPPWRLELIWRTNIQTAYSAGRYRQMTDPDVAEARPYWQYKAILDRRTRPAPSSRMRAGATTPARLGSIPGSRTGTSIRTHCSRLRCGLAWNRWSLSGFWRERAEPIIR